MNKSWTVFYDTEEELIADMMKAITDQAPYYQIVRGYEYVRSFQKYYEKYGQLTEKQMIQLKRLAYSIYSNVHNNNIPTSYRVD